MPVCFILHRKRNDNKETRNKECWHCIIVQYYGIGISISCYYTVVTNFVQTEAKWRVAVVKGGAVVLCVCVQDWLDLLSVVCCLLDCMDVYMQCVLITAGCFVPWYYFRLKPHTHCLPVESVALIRWMLLCDWKKNSCIIFLIQTSFDPRTASNVKIYFKLGNLKTKWPMLFLGEWQGDEARWSSARPVTALPPCFPLLRLNEALVTCCSRLGHLVKQLKSG